ncbi:MAG: hypothetical protein RIQ59_389 [Bacteroidota bacterium]|jgi:hypothetical protein
MKKNDQNRIYAITSKVTANQKAKFIQEAKKHNISLSEWVSGTLEMATDAYSKVNNTEQLEQLQEQNENYIQMINQLNRELIYYKKIIANYNEKELNKAEPIEEEIVYTRFRRRKLN